MGRLTSGEFNIYGKGNEQIDIARENRLRNPNGSHTTLGVLGATLLPQLISGIACYAADGAFGGGGSSSKSQEEDTSNQTMAANAQQGIQRILTANNCQSVEDLTLALQTAKNDLPSLTSNVQKLTSEYNSLSTALNAKSTRIGELKTLLGQFNQKDIEVDIFKDQATRTQYHQLKSEYDRLIGEYKKEEPVVAAKQQELEEAKRVEAAKIQEITKLTKAVDDVKEYEKQLKKAKSQDSIDNLKNNETGYITGLVKKLNGAKKQEDFNSIMGDLEIQRDAYYDEYAVGENKTIDTFFSNLHTYQFRGKKSIGA